MLQPWTGPHGLIAVGDFPNDDLLLSQILILLLIILTVVGHVTKVGGQEVRLAAAHKTRLHPHPAGGAPAAGGSVQSSGWDQLMGHVTS
jgi:hypothetical protein